MKFSSGAKYAFGVCAAVAILVGWTIRPEVARSSLNAPIRPADIFGTRSGVAKSMRPYRSGSWMAPDAKSKDLLYISDGGDSTVNVYSYPELVLKGQLTGSGLDAPTGMCVNKQGDVWIVNQDAGDILEYAHGGKSPIATLSDPGDYVPADCAVDPTTGDLAVSNGWISKGDQPLGVLIYKKARGTPINYRAQCMGAPRWLAYDDDGNLVIDDNGGNFSCNEGYFALFELPKGSGTIQQLSVSGGCCLVPGGVQWYRKGKYFAVGDEETGTIYGLQIGPSGASVVASTTVYTSQNTSAPSNLVDIWIQGAQVIVTIQNGLQNNTASFYHYPAGGLPLNTFSGFSSVEGVVISKAAPTAPP